MTKVSIILPIYNVEKYLSRCVDSLLNQTLNDIEIILATDGPENCDKICENYAKKDSRVKIVSHPGSYGKAINKGVEVATGEYIGIVETDDWCDEYMFEKMYNKAKEEDADVVKCGFYYAYDDEKKNFAVLYDGYNKNLNVFEEQKFLSSQPSIWSCIYRKDFWTGNNIKMMEERMSFIDVPVHYQSACRANKYILLKEPLYYYYQDNENQSIQNVKIFDGLTSEKYACSLINDLYPKLKEGILYSVALHLKWNFDRLNLNDKKIFLKEGNEFIRKFDISDIKYIYFEEDLRLFFNLLYKKEYFDFERELHKKSNNYPKNIFENIFCLKNSDKNHKMICLFGIKLKVPTKKFKSFIQNIFSMKNKGDHKIITFMGIKVKYNLENVYNYKKECEKLNKDLLNRKTECYEKTEIINWQINKIKELTTINGISDVRTIPVEEQEKFVKQNFGLNVRKGTSDIPVVYDIFQKYTYECVNTDKEVNTIIDAGANIGCASVYFARKYPNAKIYALEPEKSNFEMLVENTKMYPNVVPLNIGLWGTDCKLHVVDNDNGNWGFETKKDDDESKNTLTCYTIKTLLEKYDIPNIDVLKIDIEGAEKDIFEHPENIPFDKISILSVELHDRMLPNCSTAFFKALSQHPEFSLDYVWTENLVLRKVENK